MPKAGGTFTGNISFEGSTDDAFETTFAITDPTADRTITFKNESGTVAYLSDISGISTFLPLAGGTMTGQILGDDSTSASTPGYAFDGDPDTGLLRTGANELGLVTGGTSRLTIDASGNVVIPGNFTVQGTTTTIDTTTLVVKDKNIEMGAVATPTDVTADGGGITLKGTTDKTINWVDATDAWTSSERFSYPLGSAAAPALTFTGDPNTGIYSPGADQVAISTNGTGRLFVDASGNLDVYGNAVRCNTAGQEAAINARRAEGTSTSPTAVTSSVNLGTINFQGYDGVAYRRTSTITSVSDGAVTSTSSPGFLFFTTTPSGSVTPTERMRLDSSGRLGLGTSSPGAKLDVVETFATSSLIVRHSGTTGGGAAINVTNGLTSTTPIYSFYFNGTTGIGNPAANVISAIIDGSERARIDSSGRLLVGTSTTSSVSTLLLQGNSLSSSNAAILRLAQGTSAPADGSSLGSITFQDSGHVGAASFLAARDGGTWTSGTSQPSRLVFSTTADGASSPTERMRIAQNGVITIQNGAVAVIGTLTDGATITPDFAADCNFTVTLGGARTIANPTNITAGQSGSIFLVQDATGSRTAAWGSFWDFPGGTAPTLSTAANAVDRVDYIVRSSTSIHTVFTANYS
jgi:hypothetical protein